MLRGLAGRVQQLEQDVKQQGVAAQRNDRMRRVS
jgi:hypothetical protein